MDDGGPTPFEPDQLDEVLTAELDGELDAVARDFGLDAEALSARLGATPGAAERRAALVAARALLAQVPELDELAAARFRNAALLEAEHERAYRNAGRHRRGGWLVAAGGIAAAVVAIAGIAIAGGGHSSPASKSSSPAAAPYGAAATTSAPKSGAASLGAFTDPRTLAQAAVALGQARAASGQLTQGRNQQDEVAQPANSTTTDASANEPSASKSPVDAAAGPSTTVVPNSFGAATKNAVRATAPCGAPAEAAVSGPLLLRTTAMLQDRAVVVLVYAQTNAHKVVIEATNCALLNVQTLP